jgi:hypothetical protein
MKPVPLRSADIAHRKQAKALTALRDLYSQAESFGLPSEIINARFHEILTVTCKHAPEYVRTYLRGYRHALDDQLYRHCLCYGGYLDGKFYSTHGNRADYYEKHGINARDYAENGRVVGSGHYWIKHVDNGKPKPFFIK